MIHLLRTDAANEDFRYLVGFLDADLKVKDGDQHSFFSQYNKLDAIRHVIVASWDGRPAGCGAIKAYTETIAEVKRMFVLPELRGKGIAWRVLQGLEQWAGELGYADCILETGKKMTEAIRLYERNGYNRIDNYGQYIGVESSVCMKKKL